MASETEVPDMSAFIERLLRQRDHLSLFFPFSLGFSGNNQSADQEDPDQERTQTRERIILINPFTQGMVVINGAESLESLFGELDRKSGQPPASKASIEAIPCVEIGEEDKDGECAICLEEWEVGGVAKEMPCRHKFHANCVEKWLGIHGNCPVCRYTMPVDEDEVGKKSSNDEAREGSERRRVEREIWISFAFNGNRRNGDSNESPDSDDVSSPRPGSDLELDG